MLYQIVFVLAAALLANAEYSKVVSESCVQLQNSTYLFDSFLLPCASFKSAPVDLVCLTADQTTASLKTVPQWTYLPSTKTGPAIQRTFAFNDFREAFLFMAGSAQLAEKNQHHPDWHNLYNTVDVTLNTDDKGCLSTFDIELAQGMDILFGTAKKASTKSV